ncbi:metallophosphoesterase [Salirhabdus salicampi]|uniref:metallophosphoesterase n=1 Tax=Salirhabdus salicampi TaxID=476102 RepID=UPI0020C2D20A|nr:metallophosphoesterase [Salirhabdus salicampi]MCP8615616.1 metallophosphoesterase [Salirhabdus salicampi]
MLFIVSLIAILLFIGIYKAYQNTKRVTVNKIHLHDENHQHYKPHYKLNILQISDMHLENISVSAQELYNKLKNEKIDIIALTGDYLDRKWSIPKLIPYLEIFQKLNPTYGTYAVFGNHDYVLREKNFQKLKKTLADYACIPMQNENITLDIHGHPVNIIGIDDYSTNRSDFQTSYRGITKGYNLVLTHDPNAVLDMKQFHFDYLLSGHFHGGQILYPKAFHLVKMGKLPRLNMVKGLHHYDGKPFYISEGLGQTGVNIRVGSRPEITLHQLPLTQELATQGADVG